MRVNLLGAEIDALSMDDIVERAAALVRDYRPYRIMTLNPEFLYQAQSDQELLELCRRADIVTADGVGIVWACRVAGQPVPERVTGIDLMLRLAERAAAENWSIYLFGAAPGVAGEAADKLSRDFPGLRIAGTQHGYFQGDEEDRIAADINKAKTDLLFVALGAPKQEIWIDRYFGKFGSGVAVGVGGSFDVLSGRVRRAPRWVRQLHLEWLSRLLRDPSRWRRQLILPLFAWTVIRHYKLKKVRHRGRS
jgi:N-acetylglucosaminyldiphosphoundecaprenol N-acetyl-beta-D-mannosaminyltransferase